MRLPVVPPAHPARPFVHTVGVNWGDCDPALIAYTGRIPNFALDAINQWWAHQIGIDWYRLTVDHGLCTPFVHLDFEFRSPITPRDPLLCRVELRKLGRSSMTFSVEGTQAERLSFEARFICVFARTTDIKSIPVPPEIREIIAPLVVET